MPGIEISENTLSEHPPLVELHKIEKQFGGEKVLKDVSLEVPRGSVTALIGPSGGGKSTLLRCINLLEIPSGGTVRIAGDQVFPFHGNRRERAAIARVHRRRVGMVFQQFNLFPHLTVLENVVIAQTKALGRTKHEAEERAGELLTQMGLGEKLHQHPTRLSGGQQQRVAIARALSMDPELMLFDEPTSSLDPELGFEVLNVMRDLANSGMTMVVVTHEMHFAEDVADQVALLAEGVVLEQGPPRKIMRDPQHSRTRKFLTAVLDR